MLIDSLKPYAAYQIIWASSLMKFFAILPIAYTALAVCYGAPASALEVENANTVKITVFSSLMKREATGSGVLILPAHPLNNNDSRFAGSLILTNAHVILGASRIEIQNLSGRPARAAIRWFSIDWDLALLQADEILGAGFPVKPSNPTIGMAVSVVGMPEGLDWTTSTGIVSAIRAEFIDPFFVATGRFPDEYHWSFQDDGNIYSSDQRVRKIKRRLVQITAPISPGSSGGPICDSAGVRWSPTVRQRIAGS